MKIDTSNPHLLKAQLGELEFLLIGGISLKNLERLRITLKTTLVKKEVTEKSFRDTLDLYLDYELQNYSRKVASAFSPHIGTEQLLKALEELTVQLEDYRFSKFEESKQEVSTLTEEERKEAIAYLSTPDLIKRVNEDIGKSGIIGEEKNRLIMFLAFVSRLRPSPLHIISIASSGSGKSHLQEKVSELVAPEDIFENTSLSDNSIYYFGDLLKNKLLLIEELTGVKNLLYQLRILQSKKEIKKTTLMRDAKGNLKPVTLKVCGEVCIAVTTTESNLIEDNANRCLILHLDESKEQQQKIMEHQRKMYAGKINYEEETKIKRLFQNLQKVLEPLGIRNPYAEKLTLPASIAKPLRANTQYLSFIEVVTFFHQYQRKKKADKDTGEEYIETTPEDIAIANDLLKDIFLTKSDELPPLYRNFIEKIKSYLQQHNKKTFFAKELKEALKENTMKINRYLRELEKKGFVEVNSKNQKTGYEYEVINWSDFEELKKDMELLDTNLTQITDKKEKHNTSITSEHATPKSQQRQATQKKNT